MKIAILDDYQLSAQSLDCYALLNGHQIKIFTNSARGIGQLAIRLADFEVLVPIGRRTHFPKVLLDKLPKLKLISQVGKVGSHIDIVAATNRKTAIMEAPGDPAAAAELTWALIMAASRKIPQYVDNLKNGTWQTVSLSSARNSLGAGLRGRTLGILGYGAVGRVVARYGKAFGMRVVVWGRPTSCTAAAADGYEVATSQRALFCESDVVTLHLPLTDATRGMVACSDLTSMKPSALFVNTSAAALLESDALINALQQGHPGYAAIDVFDSEPLAPDSPLLRMENVLATPHIGFVEKDNYEQMFGVAFQNIIDFEKQSYQNVVNPQVFN
jgi:D-3-phosphoglycerate dehydrogenase